MNAELLARARAKGTPRQYHEWVKRQRSCISRQFSEYHMDTGEHFSIPEHYRTADNCGTGCKPDYFEVPLTKAEHDEQHRVGQYNFRPREWWEEKTELYLSMWIETK